MTSPVLFWFRRDLRLSDHPGLSAALASGARVIPVFILDPQTENLGAAPKWRLGEGLRAFAQTLESKGSRLILRRGEALSELRDLAKETGAEAVHWSRLYDPVSKERDQAVKAGLKDDGLHAESHPGHVLFEPWTVETGQGSFYKVYTPFWKSVRDRGVPEPLKTPDDLAAPDDWPRSDILDDWKLGHAMRRGAAIVAKHANIGEKRASSRLGAFIANGIDDYVHARDDLAGDGTSNLSENLSLGEISARTCWHAGQRALQDGKSGAETFLKEIVWRDFAYHLVFHTPQIVERNWREKWDDFPWKTGGDHIERWQRGLTGEPVIDAGMRQMYVTGRMHNRARMLVASYLTKHLMTHWKVGQRWFEECLTDWDPASNAMGWQWAAGSGPDAAPYFRIFNPATQADRYDPEHAYRERYVAELADTPGKAACDYFDAVPQSWGLSADDAYPDPMVDLKEGREAALAAYGQHKDD